MKIRLDLFRSFCISFFLVLAGLQSMQAHANGIASFNSYVELIPGATNLKARKQDKNGSQRSSSGEDFIIVPERTEQIFVNKARLPLNVPLLIILVVLAMCQMEVQLRFILGIPQLTLI